MPDTPEIVLTPIDGYKTLNYALLHSQGLGHVFDTMRYERAYLVRKTDLARLVEVSKGDGLAHVAGRYSLLLAKYDWKGPTKAGWTDARLQNGMEFQRIDDMMRLMELGLESPDFTIKHKPKFRADVQITGTVAYVLTTMMLNKAFPCDEADSHYLYQGFYNPGGEVTVKLTNFLPSDKTVWHFPPK